jgi:hypothetical protein
MSSNFSSFRLALDGDAFIRLSKEVTERRFGLCAAFSDTDRLFSEKEDNLEREVDRWRWSWFSKERKGKQSNANRILVIQKVS